MQASPPSAKAPIDKRPPFTGGRFGFAGGKQQRSSIHAASQCPAPHPAHEKARRRVCRALWKATDASGREGKTRASGIGCRSASDECLFRLRGIGSRAQTRRRVVRYASWETGRSRISWQLPHVNTPRWWHWAHHLVASFWISSEWTLWQSMQFGWLASCCSLLS